MNQEKENKAQKKVTLGIIHLIAGMIVFSGIIYLLYKVSIKYLIKPTRRNRVVNSLPFKRVTLLNPTPLYATPNYEDKLEATLPRGTEVLVTKIVKNKWTFFRIKLNGRTRWVIKQFVQHVPVHVLSNNNLKIGKENVSVSASLPFTYKPTDLTRLPAKYRSPYDVRKHYLRKAVVKAFIKMAKAAKRKNIDIRIISSFRSARYQLKLYLRSIRRHNNPDQRGTARPTYSEHQLGTAIDVSCSEIGFGLKESFENTITFAWLKKNMAKYGFRLSYPRNNSEGYIYEPWHLRYIGNK